MKCNSQELTETLNLRGKCLYSNPNPRLDPGYWPDSSVAIRLHMSAGCNLRWLKIGLLSVERVACLHLTLSVRPVAGGTDQLVSVVT